MGIKQPTVASLEKKWQRRKITFPKAICRSTRWSITHTY
ncbi:hypothetical protein ACBZ91_21630 [Vibrio natriegens]